MQEKNGILGWFRVFGSLIFLFFKLSSYSPIVARRGAPPPIMPAVMTPGGPLDLFTVLFRNRIIFVGQPINSQVAQRVIPQLVTLATIDENADILALEFGLIDGILETEY
uniref:Putative clp protease proteolytic subunit /Translocation-enhancing protein TepA n=1 Tax=Helianthus annuus TaxID=4232 RepID=A0A251V9E6_HELAN